MKLKNILFTALLGLALLVIPARAQQSKNIEVKFQKGQNSRTYQDAVSRTVDTYFLRAKRGQTLTVRISSPGNVARFHLGTVGRGARNPDKINHINDADLSSLTWKIDTDDDLAIPVGAIRGGTSYKLTISVAGEARSRAAKSSLTETTTGSVGSIVQIIKLDGKNVEKVIKLDPATKGAVISGITRNWETEGTEYFGFRLKTGQRLLITADSNDISIETYYGFDPRDGNRGTYEIDAEIGGDYQVVARSKTPGKKYTLTFKLK